MNAIQRALKNLRYVIPKEILEYTFANTEWRKIGVETSIDDEIRTRVINDRVLPDCNIYGGRQIEISLETVKPEYFPNGTAIFRIPKSLTENATIISALSLAYGPRQVFGINNNHNYYHQRSQVVNVAEGILRANEEFPLVTTSRLTLIGENVLLVQSLQPLPAAPWLTCNVGHDSELSDLPQAIYKHFNKLVELAVKAYIYVNVRIQLDQGYLHGGMSLGTINEFIDSYADANELYDEYVTTQWARAAFSADDKRMRRFLDFQIGNQR